MVGERHGSAGACAGRRQLQHPGDHIGYYQQFGDDSIADDHGGHCSTDRDHQHNRYDDQSADADHLRPCNHDRGRGWSNGNVVRYNQRCHHAGRHRDGWQRRRVEHQRYPVRRRHPQHRGPGYRCGRQHRSQRACYVCAEYGRAIDLDHRPCRRGQHHQQDRGGGRCHHQRYGCGRQRRRGGQRPDRDDHDCRQHQHRQGHLYRNGHRRGVVGQRDGGGRAGPR